MKKIILFSFLFSFFSFHYSYSQGGIWTWISGSNVAGNAAVFGTQGVPSVNNHPPGMYEAAEWKDKQGNFWVYGGIPTYSDLWKFNPVTLEWTWVKGNGATNLAPVYGTKGVPAAANTPGRRDYASVTWVDTTGNLWLFGGHANFRNDLWKFDISINQWTWVSGSNTTNALGTHGTKGVPSTANIPGGRNETSCSWVDTLNNLWLFGGTGYADAGGTGNLNDLFRYNIATKEWTWMKGANGTNAAPVYGTKYVSSPTNDPGGRFVYSKWKDSQGNLWFMGGFKNQTEMNDVWRYNLTTNEWTWMSGQNVVDDAGRYQATCVFDTINVPRARVESRATVTDNCGRFWLFGGALSTLLSFNYFNDLWTFNPQNTKWNWMSGTNTVNQTNNYGTLGVPAPTNRPSSRWGSVAWWGNDNKFYMFGGSANNTATCYGDLWVFNPDTSCVSTCTVSALPVASFISSDTSFCNESGACIDFTDHSTNAPTSWKWSFPGAIPDTSTQQNPTGICYYLPGTFAVTLIVGNGSGSDTLTVSPMITFATPSSPPVLTFSGDTIYSSHAAAYQWYLNGSPIPLATDSFYVITGDGVYAVQITDGNGCVRLSNGFTVSINELRGMGGIKIYPNPAKDEFTVYSLWIAGSSTIEIYNVVGEKLYSGLLKSNQETVNCKQFSKGIYFVEVANGERVYREKFMKE